MKFGFGKHAASETTESVQDTDNVEAAENTVLSETVDGDGISHMIPPQKISAENFEVIQAKANAALERNEVKGIVFNMSDVAYVSSAGLRMFSAVHRNAVSLGKSYKLVQTHPKVFNIFKMTGYAGAFDIEVQAEE